MALVQVFREGKLKGALDTFEPFDRHGEVEALPEHPLLAFENVRLTPHVAAFPVEAKSKHVPGSSRELGCSPERSRAPRREY